MDVSSPPSPPTPIRYRVQWPTFYHKIALPIFMIAGGLASSRCQHNVDLNLYCYFYYPNANTLPFIWTTAIKAFAMKHKMPGWENEFLPFLPRWKVHDAGGASSWP